MKRCSLCNRVIWQWQNQLGPWHRQCIAIFAEAYGKGVMAGYAEAMRRTQSAEQIPESAVIH